MTTSLILHAPADGGGKALPLALTGLPSEVGGLPAHYRRKRVISAGEWVHRGTRQPFAITRERLDQWTENFKKREASGIKPFVPDHHTENPKAGENFGYVVGLEREGDDLYANLQLIGDDALTLAAKNDVSVYVKADGIDAKGTPYGEHVAHIALTPDPNQPNLGPFVTIAASAGGSAVDVPIYTPATTIQKELPMLKPETQTALRTKLGLKPEATEQEIVDAAANAALNPPADPQVTALSASVNTLTAERDAAITKANAADAKVLALSANVPTTDPLVLTLMGEQFEARAEAAIEAGIPKAAVDYFGGLVKDSTGKPTTLALSAFSVPVADGKVKNTNLGAAILDGLAKLAKGGFGTGVQTGTVAPDNILRLTAGTGEQTDTVASAKAEAEKWQAAQLGVRGLK